MSGLFLLSALIALVYLMAWMIQNDGAPHIKDQKGLLQMLLPKPPGPPPRQRRRRRLGQYEHPLFPDDADAPDEIVHPLWREPRNGNGH